MLNHLKHARVALTGKLTFDKQNATHQPPVRDHQGWQLLSDLEDKRSNRGKRTQKDENLV